MAKFQFAQWLVYWLEEASGFRFEWDAGNTLKSAAKHGVTPTEAEEVFLLGQAAPLGVQVSPPVSEERVAVVGPTYTGRMLLVVFTLRGGKIRPISARPAGRRERNYHEAYLREIS
jgi:uncharacterized DUF497 family protein